MRKLERNKRTEKPLYCTIKHIGSVAELYSSEKVTIERLGCWR